MKEKISKIDKNFYTDIFIKTSFQNEFEAGARNDNRSVKLPYIYRRRSLLYYRYNFREKEA